MKNNSIVTPIVLFVLGLILLIVPGSIIKTLISIVGILIVIAGAYSIIKNPKTSEISYGILMIILGLVFILEPSTIAGIVPFILGAWIILKSIVKLQVIGTFRNTKEYIKPLVIDIITLLLGIILVFNPFRGAETIIRIIAIFILVYSALDIVNYFLMKSKRVKVIK